MKYFYISVILLLFINLYPADTLSVNNVYEEIEFSQTPTFALMMIQMIGMLIFISVLLYLGLYFFKKINAGFKNKNQTAGFKILENIYFNSKQGVSAVYFGNKIYLIGFSNNSVNLIDKIDDVETIETMTEYIKNQRKFSDVFSSFITKGIKK